jgi:hypothetical protein
VTKEELDQMLAEEFIVAPVPREGWETGYGPETLQLGDAPGSYTLSQVAAGPGTATIDWGDGESQKVRVGDRLQRYPQHEVTDLVRVPRESDRRLSDWAIEVTPPYEGGQEPYYIKHGAGGEPPPSPIAVQGSQAGDIIRSVGMFHQNMMLDDFLKRQEALPFQALRPWVLGSLPDITDVGQAAAAQGWSTGKTWAVSDAKHQVEKELGGAVHLVHTSEGHDNGVPNHIYFEERFEDGSTAVWEYTPNGPGGKPELVRASDYDEGGND